MNRFTKYMNLLYARQNISQVFQIRFCALHTAVLGVTNLLWY